MQLPLDRLMTSEFGEKIRERTDRLQRDGVAIFQSADLRKDGTPMPVEVSARLVDYQGKKIIQSVVRDISERKRGELTLRESEARYSSLFQNNSAAMLLIVPESAEIVDANPAACAFYGYDKEALTALKITDINQLPAEEVRQELALAKAEKRRHFHFRHRLASGEIRDVEVFSGPVDIQGKRLLFSSIFDVTERRKAQAQIRYLALHDPLTGLANRALLEDRLRQAMAHAQRHRESIGVFFLDLDRFKNINDSLGHQAGDLLLQKIAERLKEILREGDTISRRGGDEFIILLPRLGGAHEAAHVAEKILSCLTTPFYLQERQVHVTFSIGISLFPTDGTTLESIIGNADAAMYHAKGKGRNTFEFFRPEMTTATQERLALESALYQAIVRDELQLHYQPQVDACSREIVGIEALIRWNHPSLGSIPPLKFIPIAEECGLIQAIGAWVLSTACRQNRQWQESGLRPLKMAVNVSGRQFRQSDFVAVIDRILQETGLDPRWLELEVTEHTIMENVEGTMQTLAALKERGISLAIDDFGTGYSSLGYLRQFPIDRLKIDRSFVADIGSNIDSDAIAQAVISLARTLKLEVIAEGVETAAQATSLQQWKCDGLQGYFFGRPVPAEDLRRLLERQDAPPGLAVS
ncbi:MAG: EAL domain-containing protein [Desulfuromonadales bacterium]|nr:EAL domain-containing protein [Desulfuromonadales bacterium]